MHFYSLDLDLPIQHKRSFRVQWHGLRSNTPPDVSQNSALRLFIFVQLTLPGPHVFSRCVVPCWFCCSFCHYGLHTLAVYWPFGSEMYGISWSVTVFVWFYSIFWSLIQGIVKIFTYFVLASLNMMTQSFPIDLSDFNSKIAQGCESSRAVADTHKWGDLEILKYL